MKIQPSVSTLNAYDGFITSNMAIVPTDNGSIDAYAAGLTQLILDISGYLRRKTAHATRMQAMELRLAEFERLLGELHIEQWIRGAAEIRTKRVRKQQADRQDAQLILANEYKAISQQKR